MGLGKLYLIATPLGNLNDISRRALDLLQNIECFFAEDSREFRKLISALGVEGKKKVWSYGNHNLKASTEKAMEILSENRDVGLVTDRGTPGISDPGAMLARDVWENGGQVVPIPGPSAVTTLLSASGAKADQFQFLGFLPQRGRARDLVWESVGKSSQTVCFFESPKRIRETLEEVAERFPSGTVVVGRELTKAFEEILRFPLSELRFQKIMEKGEFCVVLEPGEPTIEEDGWLGELRARLASEKEWSKWVASRYKVSSSEVYNALQKAKSNPDSGM